MIFNEGTYCKIAVEQAFEEMVASEDYERAAMLRDLLSNMPSGMSGHSLTITTRIEANNPNRPNRKEGNNSERMDDGNNENEE